MKPWDHIVNLHTKKIRNWQNFTPEQIKGFNSYVILQYLANDINYTVAIDEIQQLNLKPEQLFYVLLDVLPELPSYKVQFK